MYKITFKDSASKELQRLSKSVIKKIVFSINELSENPRPNGVKKLKDSNENLYRIRVGDYRIIYVIDDGIKIVNIRRIGHRKDIYR
ncbi:MAG: type II toxin-antitoxin system RelE/ParE family toxin [Bacteroidota bacterium]|nr:type II toxin-antitoxin system RelE/ParE family toxin [Bacteroidota bacterium]